MNRSNMVFQFILSSKSVVTNFTAELLISLMNRCNCSDHGLRTPDEGFFIKIPNIGLGQTNWADKFWSLGFSDNLSAPSLVLWVPCPFLLSINHYFYKKTSLYIHIPNIYLGLGFEFEFRPQRVKDLAIICRQSVAQTFPTEFKTAKGLEPQSKQINKHAWSHLSTLNYLLREQGCLTSKYFKCFDLDTFTDKNIFDESRISCSGSTELLPF